MTPGWVGHSSACESERVTLGVFGSEVVTILSSYWEGSSSLALAETLLTWCKQEELPPRPATLTPLSQDSATFLL